MRIECISPINEKVIFEYDTISESQIGAIISDVQTDLLSWRVTSFKERGEFVSKFASILHENKETLSRLITLEMGKSITSARAEVDKSVWCCNFYAENTEKILSEELIDTDASKSYIRFDPLGVIFGVMPWNFPLWQVVRFIIPTLMAGNSVILKHASNVPQTALMIEKLLRETGLPENIFRVLLMNKEQIENVISEPSVKAVSLTGSEQAGRSVAAIAGKYLKKCVLELGGSDPFIVFEDADIDQAVKMGVKSRLINCGESCIAAKRFFVQKDLYDQFESKFISEMAEYKIGDPMEEDTDIGPLAKRSILEELTAQLDRSISLGAKQLEVGDYSIPQKGFYFKPSVLTDVDDKMPVMNSETFGPVAAITSFKDKKELVEKANSSKYGLGASVWTTDLEKNIDVIRDLNVGNVTINDLVSSDPRMPFGGVKNSGYGRELGSFGVKEFVNVKSVRIK